MSEPDAAVNPAFEQISALTLARGPLIVCDVDEVVLEFIAPLERFMRRAGFEFIDHRYRLVGNVRGIEDGELASMDEVRALLYGFFEAHDTLQEPVPGAAEALAALAGRAQIVMLTNMPARFREDRIAALSRHGVPYPVVVNEGPKGPAVAELARRVEAPVVFLDDSPTNLESVRDTVAGVRLIQFIADPRFLATAAEIDGIHLTSNDWQAARRLIEDVLEGL